MYIDAYLYIQMLKFKINIDIKITYLFKEILLWYKLNGKSNIKLILNIKHRLILNYFKYCIQTFI